MQNDEAEGATMPTEGSCPSCGKPNSWLDALKNAGNIGWRRKAPRRQATRLAWLGHSHV